MGVVAMRVAIHPAGVKRFGRFGRGRLHASQATHHCSAMALGQTGQGGCNPVQRLSGMARVRVRPRMERRGTLGIGEPLAGVRTHRLPVLP
jgi:hypothetical protein